MKTNDPSTTMQTVFSVSRAIGAYPTTRKSMGYAVINLSICAVVVSAIVVHNVKSAVAKPSTDTVSMILEHLESVEVSLLFFMTLAAVIAYANNDVTSVIRSIYHVHDSIFKLGLFPIYRKNRGLLLLAVSFSHIIVEYTMIIIDAIDQQELDMAVFYLICGVNEMAIHTYTAQFFCLMELLQDQIRALTSGLVHENQWYLEAIINVECHVLKTAKYVYGMYVKMISIAIVHSTIAMMTHAYEVTTTQNYVMAVLIGFELIVIVYVVDACSQLEFKVDDFNSTLFKLMRLSKGLCQNNKLYVFLTSKQTVTFTACGFFTINYSLIVSHFNLRIEFDKWGGKPPLLLVNFSTEIIAAVTTYLVILVQLTKPQEPIKFD